MAANENQVTEAKALLPQLNNIDLSDPNAHRDAILKSRTLANTLQDPGDKAMEGLMSVSLIFVTLGGKYELKWTHRLPYSLAFIPPTILVSSRNCPKDRGLHSNWQPRQERMSW